MLRVCACSFHHRTCVAMNLRSLDPAIIPNVMIVILFLLWHIQLINSLIPTTRFL